MKRRGFTLIELLAVIVILALIALIATPIILGIIDDTKKQAFKDSAYGISQAAKNAFIEIMYAGGEPKNITYRYTNGVETSSPGGYVLNYEGQKPQNGQVLLNTEGKISLILHDGKYCATKDFNEAEVTIEEKSLDDCMPKLVDESGANVPILSQGMTAIMWDGTNWVPASDIDDPYRQNWYDYEEQKWANARTNDGSMWVWIPRYAYQITSGYHSATIGTISIKFLQGITNTTLDSIQVYEDYASNTHYVKHPAFIFGSTELPGMWVSKFEMSGTTASLDSKPNVASLRGTTLGNMFISSRNMETNNKYGWSLASGLNTDGTFTNNTNNVDTHMMKNTEWGAVAYLSQSQYGKYGNAMYTGVNKEIYQNKSATYITGSSNGTPSQDTTNTQCAYNDLIDRGSGTGSCGGGASTTGNIYGIYDISGGAQEYVMGNYNNTAGGSGLTPSAINSKYINRYSNSYAIENYGDALYETSSDGSYRTSWYNDLSYKVLAGNPWFIRGGVSSNNTDAGAFAFDYHVIDGEASSNTSWHSVVLVGSGL